MGKLCRRGGSGGGGGGGGLGRETEEEEEEEDKKPRPADEQPSGRKDARAGARGMAAQQGTVIEDHEPVMEGWSGSWSSITVTCCASIPRARCASAPYTPVLTWDELHTTTLRHHNAAHGVMCLDG